MFPGPVSNKQNIGHGQGLLKEFCENIGIRITEKNRFVKQMLPLKKNFIS